MHPVVPFINPQDQNNPLYINTSRLAAQILLQEVQLVYWAIDSIIHHTPNGAVVNIFGQLGRISDECLATITALITYYRASGELAPLNTLLVFRGYFNRLMNYFPQIRPFPLNPAAPRMSLANANRVVFDAPGIIRNYARLNAFLR